MSLLKRKKKEEPKPPVVPKNTFTYAEEYKGEYFNPNPEGQPVWVIFRKKDCEPVQITFPTEVKNYIYVYGLQCVDDRGFDFVVKSLADFKFKVSAHQYEKGRP